MMWIALRAEIPLLTFPSLLVADVGDLESTRYHRLKDTFRVVLLSRSADLLNIVLAVALERLLRLVRVVKIDVRVRLANALGVGLQLIDQPVAGALEEVVLLGAVPGEVGLEYWDLPRVSDIGCVV